MAACVLLLGGGFACFGQTDFHYAAVRLRGSAGNIAAFLQLAQKLAERLGTHVQNVGQFLLADFGLDLQQGKDPSLTPVRVAHGAEVSVVMLVVTVKQPVKSGEQAE
ncbi:hypothetical protein D3C75_702850 [compost metagenome]